MRKAENVFGLRHLSDAQKIDGMEETSDEILIIVAAGVRPSSGFLENSGIKAERGIEVISRMETNVKDVYAAGDVTGLSGIWPNAMKQGKMAARNMCGIKHGPGVDTEKSVPAYVCRLFWHG